MKEFDLLKHREGFEDVAIITASTLPKSKMRIAVWLAILDVFRFFWVFSG